MAPPLRPLDDVLAERRLAPRHCHRCRESEIEPTGLPTCPKGAAALALLQHGLLEDVPERLHDLFDVLDVAEWRLVEIYREEDLDGGPGWPSDEQEEIHMLISTCAWLVEQGVEDIDGGRARLLADARRLALKYGTGEPGRCS